MQTVVKVCRFLVENGTGVEETTSVGESVFHLILRIFHDILSILYFEIGRNVSKEAEKLLEVMVQAKITKGWTVNRRNTNLISPLHLWASLECNAKVVDLYMLMLPLLKMTHLRNI